MPLSKKALTEVPEPPIWRLFPFPPWFSRTRGFLHFGRSCHAEDEHSQYRHGYEAGLREGVRMSREAMASLEDHVNKREE